MKKFRFNKKKVLPIGFGVLGAGGTVLAVYFSAKDTVKAQEKLKEAEETKGEPLTKKERFKTAAPCYIRTAITTVGAVGCELASVAIGEKIRAEFLGGTLYSIKKIQEMHGEQQEPIVIEDPTDAIYIWEHNTEQWIETTWEELYFAELTLNRELNNYSWGKYEISLFDFLEQFKNANKEKPTYEGESTKAVGWTIDYIWDNWEIGWLDFYVNRDPSDDKNHYSLDFSCEPRRWEDILPRD